MCVRVVKTYARFYALAKFCTDRTYVRTLLFLIISLISVRADLTVDYRWQPIIMMTIDDVIAPKTVMTVARTYLLHPAKHGHLIGLLQEIERSSMSSTLISKKEKKMVRREEGRETSKWKAAKTAPTPSLRAQTHEPPLTLKKLKTDIFGERKEGGNGQREYGGESQLFLLCHHRHHHHRSHSPTGRLLSLPPPFPPPLLFLFLFFPCSDSG